MRVEQVHSNTGEIRSQNAEGITYMRSDSIWTRILCLVEAHYDQ